jgi:hypothetical protein
MAQAPQGPQGAPRQNKTVKEFKGMNTQNRRNAIPEGAFAWLENIQPIGPGHLHSIPGRSEAVVRIPPFIPPETCTDATERGQQDITIEDRFDQENSFPPNGNLRTSWGYITALEEVWTLIGEASCAGGNMGYFFGPGEECCQLNHWQSPVIVAHPALIDPNALLPAINTMMGTSDEPIYGTYAAGVHFYFPNSSTHLEVFPNVNRFATYSDGETMFTKRDTTIYWYSHDATLPGPDNKLIILFDTGTGLQTDEWDSIADFNIGMMAATTGFLYCLGTTQGDVNGQAIKKIDRATGLVTATFMIDNISPNVIGVVNDNLIYILCNGSTAALYYLKNFTTLVFVGYTDGQGISPFSFATGFFVGGAMYYGANGFAGFTTDIFKITLDCPEGSPATPIIASANRGSASVADGGTINASWADVLEPDASDTIQLHSAPVGGDLGFTAASLINSQPTDGLGTSSITYTIPGGTAAGTYVFMYAALGGIYVATSPTFTVT